MVDTTYNTKVYLKQGGDEMVVASGGAITIESGGAINVNGSDLIASIAALSGLDATELGFLNGTAAGVVTALKAAIYNATGFVARSSATLAALGNSQGTAAPVVTELTAVTGADGTKGVVLPTSAADFVAIVINTDATNGLLVYPATGAQINALGANAAYTITPGQVAIFIGRSSILWYTAAATDTITGLTASAAELNVLDAVVAGTVSASKGVVVDANKAVDTLRATTDRTLGGTGVSGEAAVQTEITKAVAAFTDTVAKTVFTVTVPNAAHAAVIEVDALGVMGAGGAVGAGESSRNSKYQITLARTAGVDCVAAVSAAIGGAAATVAGAAAITSVVVTATAMVGAVGATQTFDIQVAITKAGGAGDNHTLVATARILNQNAAGVTIA